MEWYGQSAAAGFAWGQFNLASLLLAGIDGPGDRAAALPWFVRAARQGHAKAINMLGHYREEGWHGRADARAAQLFYRRAAEAGDFRGQFNHARLLNWQGRRKEALVWLERSILGGIPDFWREIGPHLARLDDPTFQALGRLAIKLAADSAAQNA